MADRKQTPQNLLDDLLGGGRDAGTPVSQDTSVPVHQRAGRTARKPTGKTAGQATKRPSRQPGALREQAAQEPEGEKPKATYYLSQEALDGLDGAWLQLRKMAQARDRARISKSAIVEQAILLALTDLEAMGQRSSLAKRLSL